jgi:DNA polymerase-1
MVKLKPFHPIIQEILDYRTVTKLKSTYCDGMIKLVDEWNRRLHTSFNQTITTTGRLSSTEPNLQNIPIRTQIGREIRKFFIAEDDYVLVDADYSQIELRVLAHISGDETLINAFNNNIDIHRLTASQVFGVSEDNVTPEMRSNAKAVNFGIVYGISDFSLSEDIGVPVYEARRYIEGYFEKYPKVQKFMKDIVEYAYKNGYVKTMFNRIRYIPELQVANKNIASFGERIARNTPIQGSAADIIKVAMIACDKRFKAENLKSRLILQVHDELIIEAYKDEIDIVTEIVKYEMENVCKMSVPLIADISVGKSWYEAKQ